MDHSAGVGEKEQEGEVTAATSLWPKLFDPSLTLRRDRGGREKRGRLGGVKSFSNGHLLPSGPDAGSLRNGIARRRCQLGSPLVRLGRAQQPVVGIHELC
jgi:hypothetical protein